MIKSISKVSELPQETLQDYRKKGWSDDEIMENVNDAADFLNSQIWCALEDKDIPIAALFETRNDW